MKYAGSNWIHSNLKTELSPFGEKVADLLGQMYLGIYHLPVRQLQKVNWTNPTQIAITVDDGDFATFDGNLLTRFVFLCHKHFIRGEISSSNHGHLTLTFWPRVEGASELWRRHPTLEQHIETLKQAFE